MKTLSGPLSRVDRCSVRIRSAAVGCLLLSCTACDSDTFDPTPEQEKYFQAQDAVAEKNPQEAIRLLTESLEIKPTSYAYRERARLLIDAGQQQQAIADCEAGLELAPDDKDLQWLLGECRKPAEQRFQRGQSVPPSSLK